MFYSDDPIADFERHDAQKEEELQNLPVCTCCEKPIQQERAVRINGDWYCDECLDDMREDTEEW